MNDKIKELAVKAGLAQIYNGTEYPKLLGKFFPNLSGPTTEQMEQFAELIVQEVFSKIEDERHELYPPVIDAVKTHFGIEDER